MVCGGGCDDATVWVFGVADGGRAGLDVNKGGAVAGSWAGEAMAVMQCDGGVPHTPAPTHPAHHSAHARTRAHTHAHCPSVAVTGAA